MPQESLDRNFTNMNSIHESLEIHVRFVHRFASDDSDVRQMTACLVILANTHL